MYSCKCVPVLSGVMVSGRGFLVFDPGVLVMCSSMEGFPDLDGLRCGEEISLVSQSVCCPLRGASVGFGSGVGVPGGVGGRVIPLPLSWCSVVWFLPGTISVCTS